MLEPLAQFEQSLKAAGYSVTKPRRETFAALLAKSPLSLHELVRACPGIDRATIYRTIALFERLGIVQRLQIGWKYKLELGDAFQHHHHHFSCMKCGKVIDIAEDKLIENRIAALSREAHFRPSDHQLEIRGLCTSCIAQGKRAAAVSL